MRPHAYTLVEANIAVAAFGAIALLAVPALSRARARFDVAAARDAFIATQALARQVGGHYGRRAVLHIDTAGNRLWVTVDTSAQRTREVKDTIGPVVRVADEFGGVQLDSNRQRLCFDALGLGTARGDCELPNATVVFSRAAASDTVTISRLGRTLRR